MTNTLITVMKSKDKTRVTVVYPYCDTREQFNAIHYNMFKMGYQYNKQFRQYYKTYYSHTVTCKEYVNETFKPHMVEIQNLSNGLYEISLYKQSKSILSPKLKKSKV